MLKNEESMVTTLFVWDDQKYWAQADAAGTTEAAFTTEPSTYVSLISPPEIRVDHEVPLRRERQSASRDRSCWADDEYVGL